MQPETNLFSGEFKFWRGRYEFEKCLPADFNKDNVTSERKGDTVVVNFEPVKVQLQSAFIMLNWILTVILPIIILPLMKILIGIIPSEK